MDGTYMVNLHTQAFLKKIQDLGKQRVHPKIFLKGKQGETLMNSIEHYYCKSISDLINKLDSYSTSSKRSQRKTR